MTAALCAAAFGTSASAGGIAVEHASVRTASSQSGGSWNFVSEPWLHPPAVSITVDRPGVAPGYVFLATIKNWNHGGEMLGQYGPMIVDNQGNPVWAYAEPAGLLAMDLNRQLYMGRPVLTWWQGTISPSGYGTGVDVIVNDHYQVVAILHAGAGFPGTDHHELHLTPWGTALVTAYRPVPYDLSSYGGSRHGRVLDSVVQEIDIRTGRLVFEWDPLKHVPLSESYSHPGSDPWDAYHVNSIDYDSSHNLLVSMRNTSAVYYVDRHSGRVRWQLGGQRSSFKLGPGVRFNYQHDARFGPHGTVTLFDNGGAPPKEPQSRGLVITLNRHAHTARLVHAYDHNSPKLLAGSMGSTELLANGDVFEGYGAKPYFSEYTVDGQLVFDGHYHGPDESYRAFRHPWVGQPLSPPSMALRSRGSAGVTLYASWNGATQVGGWQVLAGPTAKVLTPIGSVQRDGFETAIDVRYPGPYFAVRALDAHGHVIGTSAPQATPGL